MSARLVWHLVASHKRDVAGSKPALAICMMNWSGIFTPGNCFLGYIN